MIFCLLNCINSHMYKFISVIFFLILLLVFFVIFVVVLQQIDLISRWRPLSDLTDSRSQWTESPSRKTPSFLKVLQSFV